MNEVILNIVNTTISSFDIPFCLICNIATYVAIKAYLDAKPNSNLTTWNKRVIFILVSSILAIGYYAIGSDIKVLINSFILAPVSWSWIFKPICNKLNIDYHSKDNNK